MKKVNFVFDWLGPNGPTPNNHPPSITELINISGHSSVTKKSDELVLELTRPPTQTMKDFGTWLSLVGIDLFK